MTQISYFRAYAHENATQSVNSKMKSQNLGDVYLWVILICFFALFCGFQIYYNEHVFLM